MDISQAGIFLGRTLFPSYESEVVFLGFFLDLISGGVSEIPIIKIIIALVDHAVVVEAALTHGMPETLFKTTRPFKRLISEVFSHTINIFSTFYPTHDLPIEHPVVRKL